MSGYVPTTEEIADWYAHKGGTGEFYNSRLTKRMNEFDRWLAAHDAEVRAAALSEQDETEWEYGYELIESDTRDVLTRGGAFESEEVAAHWARNTLKAERDPEYPPLDVRIVHRCKAGPWMPLEQEKP